MAGTGIFQAAGAPGINRSGRFDGGGIAASGGSQDDRPIQITIQAQVVVGKNAAEGIFIVGGQTNSGRKVIVNQIKDAQLNREL
jgi:hypothetical protein